MANLPSTRHLIRFFDQSSALLVSLHFNCDAAAVSVDANSAGEQPTSPSED